MTPLEPGFEPTQIDIICARGRRAYNHEGNQAFRKVLEQNLDKYKSATTKQQKTIVVNALLDEIKEKSQFVRKLTDGKWIQVPEHVAKEKIGQGFRDLLHTQYRSSTKSKVKLRRERRKRQRSEDHKGHGATDALETFEPLPLDDSTASTDSLIYDCHPFDFEAQEGTKCEDEQVQQKPEASLEAPETKEKTQCEVAPIPHQGSVQEGSCIPTFVSPASPSDRQSRAYHQAPGDGLPPTHPDRPTSSHPASWVQYHQREGTDHPPPPPRYSPSEYQDYHSRPHYSPPPYSPPQDYARSHAPPPHQHHYPPHRRHRATSPHSGTGRWTPHHHSHTGHHGSHYTTPHTSSWSLGPATRFSCYPSPEDYYTPASPRPRRVEYQGSQGSHGYHHPYPPGGRPIVDQRSVFGGSGHSHHSNEAQERPAVVSGGSAHSHRPSETKHRPVIDGRRREASREAYHAATLLDPRRDQEDQQGSDQRHHSIPASLSQRPTGQSGAREFNDKVESSQPKGSPRRHEDQSFPEKTTNRG